MKLRSLDRKLLRDLYRLRGQVLAIALVMASGVAMLVMSLSVIESLAETASAYYERYRFAHVFAHVTRAPEHVIERIRQIPGVLTVESRIMRMAILDVSGFEEPIVAQLVSIPDSGEPLLNRLALRQGSLPAEGRREVLVSESFALAHGLRPGSTIRVIMNGHWRELRISGIALSPEFVYAIAPGALMADDRRFGILWLPRKVLEAAYDLDGAFNAVSLELLRGTDPQNVIDQLDVLLERYGGSGAYARADQMSHWFLSNEIQQLRTLARFLPAIFLAVSAFLTHMVLARLIAVERSEIGLLKAFGYTNAEVAWHYVKMVLAIGTIGVVLGWLLGSWLGRYNTHTYAEFFHFPFLLFRPGTQPYLIAAVASLGAALVGALSAVRRATRLAPAEAMVPPAPPLFRRSRFATSRVFRWLDQPTTIMLRQLSRWPVRSFLTSAGIGMSVAVMVISLQWLDSVHHLVDVYFRQAQLQDVTLGFAEVRSADAVFAARSLPGVIDVEPSRIVAARLRAGHREKREAIQGVPAFQRLQKVYDASGETVRLPPGGLVLSTTLAKRLGVKRGDTVTLEVLEGRQPVVDVPVVELFETYIGAPAYMEIGALNRLMREGKSVSGVHLRVDSREMPALFRELKQVPLVSTVSVKQAAIDSFNETLARTIVVLVSFFVAFSCALAFGVTYNSARTALSERGRELATLRVLGFTRGEISYILLSEIGVLTLAALPLGCLVGYFIAQWIAVAFETELYRVPFVIERETFAWAMVVGVLASAATALLVRRKLDRLDLIAVLKTRE